jgi:tetratricopeptide (TPR) repeat protein
VNALPSVFELSAAVEPTPVGSDERLGALEALAAHPCARHTVLVTEVWSEISQIYRQRSEWDLAIDAWEHAIQLGYRGTPHPRAEIAELNLLAGRRADGDAIYQQLVDRYPDDVWLYNSAALTYLDVGDHATALRWIDQALELSIDNGDPVGLVGQLADMRDRALRGLGRDADDELARRVESFVPTAQQWPSRFDETRGEVEPSTEPCSHCGARPERIHWIPAAGDGSNASTSTVIRTLPAASTKVPRNSPCPCGSGKKAKHCCHR